MKVAPVSADLLIKLALTATVIGGLYYAGRKVADALPSLPDFSSWTLPSRYTEVELQAAYQENLGEARANPTPATLGSLFVNNPNNFDLKDLVPPGYTVNQWGGLEPISETRGVTGGW